MRGAAFAVVLLALPPPWPPWQPPPVLLTVPLRDRLRSAASPPPASVSADGRLIAFASYERISPDDTDPQSDIYVIDRETGLATLQSAGIPGLILDADCAAPRISGDGRYVVFSTTMDRGGDHFSAEIVLRDRLTGSLRRIATGGPDGFQDGWSGDASISDDGRVVAFASTATNLVPGLDPNGAMSDIYLFDLPTGGIRRLAPSPAEASGAPVASMAPSVSGDGRYVAFTGSPGTMRDGPQQRTRREARPPAHVYVTDTKLGKTTRIAPGMVEPDGPSMAAAISRDGRVVAFTSEATNLVPADRNRSADVFLYDRETGSIVLVSRNRAGLPANGSSASPSPSADGRLVAFQSDASDLVCTSGCPSSAEDINLVPDVFVFDRASGGVIRVSTSADGGWMEESGAPAVDATASVIVFTSKHPTDPDDVRDDFDLFVFVPAR